MEPILSNLNEKNTNIDFSNQIIRLLAKSDGYYQKIWQEVDDMMKRAFTSLGQELGLNLFKRIGIKLYWIYISQVMRKMAKNGSTLTNIENKVTLINGKLFKNPDLKLPYLRKRAQRMYDQIEPLLKGCRIIDIGCGDGMLQKIIDHEYETIGIDVIDYRASENNELDFVLTSEGNPIPIEDDFSDTSILWTVLHHSNNPTLLLRETCRVTRQRIIIVEGYIEDNRVLLSNCFFDWFFNRPGKSEDVNVPFNYKTKNEWEKLFENLGWQLIYQKDLGIDELVVPEHHYLYVLEPMEPLDEVFK